ncbi:MAG: winged helix-turn-helix transcriptional regulator [Gemmatimonadaceae bacterium]
MRSYGQFCGLAKGLDVIGDRWTLLIVRELLIRGPSRYTDMRSGLPGIPTNLLADRLRELEEAELLRRELSVGPGSVPVYALTSRGEALEPVIAALGRWAAPLLQAPAKDDVFLPHWLVLPARLYLVDRSPGKAPVQIEVRDGNERVTIETANGRVAARLGSADKPDAVLTGPTPLAWQLLTRKMTLHQARKAGLVIDGRAAVLTRFGVV